MTEGFKSKFNNEKGQTLVEYALILVLIAIVVIVIMKVLGRTTSNVFSTATSALTNP
ncbi:MAG: hypothetical protein CXR31_06165 [Geobacter sp.]|nr:MAG: hypothetical protein CXR31_06165 [Geobacter sp.]